MVAFCYNTCLFINPTITILKVVLFVKIMCDRISYHYGGLGEKPPAPGQFLQLFFQKKKPFQCHLNDVLNVFRAIRKSYFTKILKSL